VASLSQGRTAAAQCGLFTYKSVPVIFEPPCTPRGGYESKQNGHTLQKYDITQRQFHTDILSLTDPVPILTPN